MPLNFKLVLNSDDYENRKDFCYEYKRGVWIDCEYGWMWLESRFDVYRFGKVKAQLQPSAGYINPNRKRCE